MFNIPPYEKTTFHGISWSCPFLSTVWDLLVCFACTSDRIAQSWYSESMKEMYLSAKCQKIIAFFMLITRNRSSFLYSCPSVPIVLKYFTNKVKSTSLKHLMLELTCMQNTQYWMRCTKHYSTKICYGNYGVIFRIWQIGWCTKCLDTGGLLGMHTSGNKITMSPRQGLNFYLTAENFWQESFKAAVDFLS